MKQPEAFRRFARGLHQDIGMEARDIQELARVLLSNLDKAQRRELRDYIDHLRRTLTRSEIKGVLNRASRAVRFNSGGADELLRVAAEQLHVEQA